MAVLICALLAVGAIGFTLFVREQDIPAAAEENPELKQLEDRKQVLYENLKDLQFEYHQGKLSDEDYQSLKQGFLYDLAGVMDSIERLEARRPKRPQPSVPSETSVSSESSRKQERPERQAAVAVSVAIVTCPSCGGANSSGNRFCGHCGKALSN
jgi:hypothetical protein